MAKMAHYCCAAALLTVFTVSCATAQRGRPADHDCRVALNKFNSSSNSEAHRWAVMYGQLERCGSEAANAFAEKVRTADPSMPPDVLRDFLLRASTMRHPAILSAAVATAQNPSASLPWRIGAIQIAFSQYNPQVRFIPRQPGERERSCHFDMASHMSHSLREALPEGYENELLSMARAILSQAEVPEEVRRSAACIRYFLEEIGLPELSQ